MWDSAATRPFSQISLGRLVIIIIIIIIIVVVVVVVVIFAVFKIFYLYEDRTVSCTCFDFHQLLKIMVNSKIFHTLVICVEPDPKAAFSTKAAYRMCMHCRMQYAESSVSCVLRTTSAYT